MDEDLRIKEARTARHCEAACNDSGMLKHVRKGYKVGEVMASERKKKPIISVNLVLFGHRKDVDG